MDVNNGVLNFTKLNRDNYKSWKFNMRMLLMNQGLYSLIEDTEPKLGDDAPVKEILTLNARKAKALSLICLSIEEDLNTLVREAITAKEAWNEIASSFEPTTRARLASLRAEFMQIRFNPPETMAVYLGRLLTAVKDLELAGKTIPDDEVAFQMLHKLPDHYDNVVMQLYQLPAAEFTSTKVRKALLAEYDRLQHRDIVGKNDEVKTSAFITPEAQSSKPTNLKSLRKPYRKQNEARKCFNCEIIGHLYKDCRKPKSTFKYQNRDSVKEAMYSAFTTSNHEIAEWIIDTAATHHFCNDSSLFLNLNPKYDEEAATADGKTKICGVGNVNLIIQQSKAMFVRVEMYHGRRLVKCKRTQSVTGGRKVPELVFDESFGFGVSGRFFDSCSLGFIVVLEEEGVHLGKVVIGPFMYARGDQLQHWQEMLSNPRNTVTRWHSLENSSKAVKKS